MALSARENLLRTLRCDEPQWIPVCPHLFPNENPTQGIPAALDEVFRASNGSTLARDIIRLGEYLGAHDFMIPVHAPAALESACCTTHHVQLDASRVCSTLSTPLGDLHQITTFSDGAPSLVTERYVKTVDDAARLLSYFASLQVVRMPEILQEIEDTRQRLGDRGILFCRTVGTPLGMCYRVYSDLTNLIYLLADEPVVMGDLFACMEEKYLQLYEAMLRDAPAIDAYLGMDDTSTTLISPEMFRRFNVDLTNARADACHRYGKIYLHHSCGLIRDLLPIYRMTRIDGVDAFTAPPIGDVGYARGRTLLGQKYSMHAGLSGGVPSLDAEAIDAHVAAHFADAHEAGNVVFSIGGAHLTFPAMERMYIKALEMQTVGHVK